MARTMITTISFVGKLLICERHVAAVMAFARPYCWDSLSCDCEVYYSVLMQRVSSILTLG